MSKLPTLSQALQDLLEFLDSHAVAAGPYQVVRGTSLQQLERRAGRVVEAMAAASQQPGSPETLEPGNPLRQACQEALRLRRAANLGFTSCIDARLDVRLSDIHELFERAFQEESRRTACPKAPAIKEEATERSAAPIRTPHERGKDRPPASRRVPKHVEMKGKAAKLTELIEAEVRVDAGRTITRMCQDAGISRETFQTSKHFDQARLAWARLQESRTLKQERRQ